MSVLAPTILADNPSSYKQQVERVTGFAERVHIDLTDGEFAPTFTIGVNDLWAPEGWTVDVHVMAHDLNQYVPKLIALRPNMIIVHAESRGDVAASMKTIQQAGIRAGLALTGSIRFL